MQDQTRETSMSGIGQQETEQRSDAVSFTERMLASDGFMALFREGMGLVEATAAYLDGDGRAESKSLDRSVALGYAVPKPPAPPVRSVASCVRSTTAISN